MLKPVLVFSFLFSFAISALSQCPPGEIPDCNGNCYPSSWIGDGICDDGIEYPSDFMCAEFNWDAGDCDNCPAGMIADCNGICWPVSLIGNGACNNGALGGPNFNCEVFGYDGGDCAYPGCTDPEATNYNPDADFDNGSCYYTPCPPGQFDDCNGICWPDSLLELVGNWHCHGGFWLNNATYFYLGPVELDLNCEKFNFDGGDCITRGCTDPQAANYYEHATEDDGTCFYGECDDAAADCMGNCMPEFWIGTNECSGEMENPQTHLFYGAYPDHLIQNVPVGDAPRGMCVLPDGSKAYIGCASGISVVDLESSCATVTNIAVSGLTYAGATSPDGQKVYAANATTDQVLVINTNTDVIVATIAVGDSPLKICTSQDGQFVYVSCNMSHNVYMISTATLSVVHVFNTGEQPRNICLSPDDSKLYTADWLSFTMSAFSTEPPYELIATVPVDYFPQAILATPDDKYVLIANFGFDLSYDHISVIRTEDWQVIARLQTGAGPEDMVFIGDQGQYLYVSNWGQPCCFYAAYDFCCSATSQNGSATIIAMPDFDMIVPPGTVPDTIPYLNYTLSILPLEAEYSFGMDTAPSGEFVYCVNMYSDMMSVIGFAPETFETSGETCEDAIVLTTLSDCIENNTNGRQDDYNEVCPFNESGGADIVFSYTPPASVSGSFDLCNSCYDSKVYIYEDVCGDYNSGTAIYCNDDYCGLNGWRSHLAEVTLYEGHTYYIVVDGYGTSDAGKFNLCFDMSCTSDLNNDGLINVSDLLLLVSGYGTLYDTSSILLFLADFGQVCAP